MSEITHWQAMAIIKRVINGLDNLTDKHISDIDDGRLHEYAKGLIKEELVALKDIYSSTNYKTTVNTLPDPDLLKYYKKIKELAEALKLDIDFNINNNSGCSWMVVEFLMPPSSYPASDNNLRYVITTPSILQNTLRGVAGYLSFGGFMPTAENSINNLANATMGRSRNGKIIYDSAALPEGHITAINMLEIAKCVVGKGPKMLLDWVSAGFGWDGIQSSVSASRASSKLQGFLDSMDKNPLRGVQTREEAIALGQSIVDGMMLYYKDSLNDCFTEQQLVDRIREKYINKY